MLSVRLYEDAARTAYLASFHAAQAYIFERAGRSVKSHGGVQTEFFRLTRQDTRVDAELRRFLSRSYEFKSVADYFTGPGATTSATDSNEAVTTAKHFVDHIAELTPIPESD